MAIGGSYNKGSNNSSNNGGNYSNNSNRSSSGRSYGMMLVVAFGAALLGFLILHKLRERRIYNLIVKQKDSDFFSLHLLLQKEREYYEQVKRKNEEMKAKMYFLRTQKMELERRVLEMQSTIDSLKDEFKTMELAYDEKQREIKMLRAQQDDHKRNGERESNIPQVVALVETLKLKEAEIAVLKRRLEIPEKVWSVSSDDPSSPSPPVNVTMAGFETSKYQSGKDDVKREYAKDDIANTTNVVSQNGRGNSNDGGFKGRENGQLEKLKEEADEVGANGVWSTVRGKRGFIGNRVVAKNRRLENNGRFNDVSSKRGMRFHEDNGIKKRVKEGNFNRQEPLVSENQLEGRKTESDIDSLKSGSSEKKVASYSVVETVDQKAANRESEHREVIGIPKAASNNKGSEDVAAKDAQELEKHYGSDDKLGSNSEQIDEEYKDEIEE